MNRTWLGWGLEGKPMAEIDREAFLCSEDAEESESSEAVAETDR